MAFRIEVVIGSVREGRAGERVARWIHGLASRRPEFNAGLADLKEPLLPIYAHAQSPKALEAAYPEPAARAWVERVVRADGFLFVTPEYNHGYPPALKSALDWAYAGWNRKPAGFVSYGGSSGGTRAVQQLRQVVIELQMAPLRAEVNIPFVGRAFDEAGNPRDELHAKRAAILLDELLWWTRALQVGRAAHPAAAHVAPPAPVAPAPVTPASGARS